MKPVNISEEAHQALKGISDQTGVKMQVLATLAVIEFVKRRSKKAPTKTTA